MFKTKVILVVANHCDYRELENATFEKQFIVPFQLKSGMKFKTSGGVEFLLEDIATLNFYFDLDENCFVISAREEVTLDSVPECPDLFNNRFQELCEILEVNNWKRTG